MKKKATAIEKIYMGLVASLGCVICGKPATIHHPRFSQGMGQRASHFLVIPLCKYHHQDGNHGHAIHAGEATFEQNYGTEAQLLAETIEKMFNSR